MDIGIVSTEAHRLAALHRYDVLDTPPEEAFDRLTRLARSLLQTPIVLVSLVDADRQWFKSRQGLAETEMPRDLSFCTHTIQRDTPLVVCDATADPRFCDNPLVTGDPKIRFYLGVPLRTPDGHNIGALCAIDRQPRQPDDDQVAVLQDLARLVVDALELRQLATTDSLTGTLTRRAFLHGAEQELERARRHGHAMSVVMLDADHFKAVNDRYGHAAGDVVLRAIARHGRAVMRSADSLARLGGEEFALLLPETGLAGAEATAERLRQAIAATVVETAAGAVSVTVSLGVAALETPEQTVAALLAAADAALYRAKQAGRNRVVCAR